MTYQKVITNDGGNVSDSNVQEIKKSRRTVLLGPSLQLPANGVEEIVPLTPPLSERASGEVEELFTPKTEERYESVDLSNSEGDNRDWDYSTQESIVTDPSDEVDPT